MRFWAFLVVLRLNVSQISFNLVENPFATRHVALFGLGMHRNQNFEAANFYHGVARCSGRKFCSEFFTHLFEHFCAYLRLHQADHSDLGITGKNFSSCRS